jgi:hypothetical protein
MLNKNENELIFTQFKTDQIPWISEHTYNIKFPHGKLSDGNDTYEFIDEIVTVCKLGTGTYLFDMQKMVKEGLENLDCDSNSVFKLKFGCSSVKRIGKTEICVSGNQIYSIDSQPN